jgi:hypothetical protein
MLQPIHQAPSRTRRFLERSCRPGRRHYALRLYQTILQTIKTSVQADNAAKVYGQAIPAFTATVTGFVAGESLASLTGSLAFSTSANQYSLPGVYSIVPSDISSSNYTISFMPGTLTISKASSSTTLSMTPNPSTRGQTVRLTAIVTAIAPGVGTPSNSVQFISNGTVLGTAGLMNGVATLNTSFSRKGTYALTVIYSGDNGFTGSSGSGTLQVRWAGQRTFFSFWADCL